jgi:hypothetical protein
MRKRVCRCTRGGSVSIRVIETPGSEEHGKSRSKKQLPESGSHTIPQSALERSSYWQRQSVHTDRSIAVIPPESRGEFAELRRMTGGRNGARGSLPRVQRLSVRRLSDCRRFRWVATPPCPAALNPGNADFSLEQTKHWRDRLAVGEGLTNQPADWDARLVLAAHRQASAGRRAGVASHPKWSPRKRWSARFSPIWASRNCQNSPAGASWKRPTGVVSS